MVAVAMAVVTSVKILSLTTGTVMVVVAMAVVTSVKILSLTTGTVMVVVAMAVVTSVKILSLITGTVMVVVAMAVVTIVKILSLITGTVMVVVAMAVVTILSHYLEVTVLDLQDVGDVERSVASAARVLHHLSVDVPWGRHQHHVTPFVTKQEGGITDLPARQQEVVLRADGVDGQVVDLLMLTNHKVTSSAKFQHCTTTLNVSTVNYQY